MFGGSWFRAPGPVGEGSGGSFRMFKTGFISGLAGTE